MESQSSQLALSQSDLGAAAERAVATDAPLRRPIKVLIDGRKIGHGGIGTYITNLVIGLVASGEAKVTVISSRSQAESSGYPPEVKWIFDSSKPYSFDELVLLPRRIKFSDFDIFHAPHYTLPFGVPIPKVVTIHDLIHISHPERFYYPFIAKRLITSSARRADSIISVSQHTCRQLRELTGAAAEKIRHIPNAIVPNLVAEGAPRAALARRCAEMTPYFLAVFSNIKPHKGLRDLILAFQSLRHLCAHDPENTGSRQAKLVLVGFGTEEILHSPELLELVGHEDGIFVLGSVSAADLATLYRKSKAVVVPSLIEGFCLPAVEAHANGTSVVCRPVPALLEQVSQGDVVARDFGVSALSEALLEVLRRDPVARASSVEAGSLAQYDRDTVTALTLSAYRDVLRGVAR